MKPPVPAGAAGAAGAGSAEGAEGAGAFGVRVHMARYFGDERARAWVQVARARRVRWLARRLRALFALPPRFALLARGHLLPPDEPLALLRPGDVVDVVPARAPGSGADDSDAAGGGDLVDHHFSDEADEPEAELFAPSPAEPAPELDGEDDLSEHKRRALNMLDRYCGKEQFVEEVPRAVRPRRRRVRRRRREPPTASPAPTAPPAALAPAAPPAPAAGEGAVLRNDAAGARGARGARVVRPLGGVP